MNQASQCRQNQTNCKIDLSLVSLQAGSGVGRIHKRSRQVHFLGASAPDFSCLISAFCWLHVALHLLRVGCNGAPATCSKLKCSGFWSHLSLQTGIAISDSTFWHLGVRVIWGGSGEGPRGAAAPLVFLYFQNLFETLTLLYCCMSWKVKFSFGGGGWGGGIGRWETLPPLSEFSGSAPGYPWSCCTLPWYSCCTLNQIH